MALNRDRNGYVISWTKNQQYSQIIKRVEQTDYSEELGGYFSDHHWDESVSVSEGTAVIVKDIFFKLADTRYLPRNIPPTEVLSASGFPVRKERLPEDTRYVYYGNGTLEHLDIDSKYWKYSAEYTIQGGDLNDDEDEEEEPWEEKPSNFSISFPEVKTPFKMAYNENNNRTHTDDNGVKRILCPVVNTAGDYFNVETSKYMIQMDFTYNMKPSNFRLMDGVFACNNTTNAKALVVCGITIPENCGLISSITPEFHAEYTDAGGARKKKKWVEIKCTILIDPYMEHFNRRILNMGNRALFPSGQVLTATGSVVYSGTAMSRHPSEIYSWRTFDRTKAYGQSDSSSDVVIGNKYALQAARRLYDSYRKPELGSTLFSAVAERNWGEFQYEKLDNFPLKSDGSPDTGVYDPSASNYRKPLVREFKERKSKDWSVLHLPKKWVQW